ncbi:RdgB/HAM1 family non-canonical purine NTP pyrophosphatase [Hoeflea prorocentri]|uniref:dITP/XTP pyrophosphatase n=1 Tax=Hoeflea prorocentri TaxID=1922333 RepID=A0A9X3UKN1_9HYPH|nr:RdgB/HAM1 family non-canonical purine NTP pyrophosphatase [Hoeflea prorocentri]MCY6383057.1 RdgB/HAM1 family non-canonical purine NTP pyrophosphatase [Hoeflea prorocentri]MDA5400857.1 RdgB/HAM1 family non-canonical purine NTP pyrophosphatase [Hoeflea prorocentri]
MRQLEDRKLVIASHNQGKVRELRQLLDPLGYTLVTATELSLDEPEETGVTFEENAELKARAAASASGLPSLSDDSGLAVDGLDGAPGIYSARWAGPKKDFGEAMRRVNEELEARAPDNRTARFVSVICLAWPDGHVEFFRGEVEGTLVWPPRGDQGFGYDPVFLPEGYEKTFGEMSAEQKHGWTPGQEKALSHRARAFKLFAEQCLTS